MHDILYEKKKSTVMNAMHIIFMKDTHHTRVAFNSICIIGMYSSIPHHSWLVILYIQSLEIVYNLNNLNGQKIHESRKSTKLVEHSFA